MTDSNVYEEKKIKSEFDEVRPISGIDNNNDVGEEKKTESGNIRLQKKNMISALIKFGSIIEQISNIAEESGKSLLEITSEWKNDIREIRFQYKITEKEIEKVKKSKEDIAKIQKRINFLQKKLYRLKSNEKAVELLKNKHLSEKYKMGKGIEDLPKKLNELLRSEESDYQEIKDETEKLIVYMSIYQCASETASIGPILTGKLLEFVDDDKNNINTLKEWKDAVKKGNLKSIKGIGKRRANVLNNIRKFLFKKKIKKTQNNNEPKLTKIESTNNETIKLK